MACSLYSQSVPQYHSTFCCSSNGYQGICLGAKRHAVANSHIHVRGASKIRKNNCATLVLQVQISKHTLYVCSKEYSQRRKNYTRQRNGILTSVLRKLIQTLISFTNFNAQFLYSLTICMLHYNPRHVSSINMLLFRRTNCIIIVSGIVTLCTAVRYIMRNIVDSV
jgi:hypothetical protein